MGLSRRDERGAKADTAKECSLIWALKRSGHSEEERKEDAKEFQTEGPRAAARLPAAGTVGAARGLQAREGRSKRPERRHTLVFSLPWPKSSRVFSRRLAAQTKKREGRPRKERRGERAETQAFTAAVNE